LRRISKGTVTIIQQQRDRQGGRPLAPTTGAAPAMAPPLLLHYYTIGTSYLFLLGAVVAIGCISYLLLPRVNLTMCVHVHEQTQHATRRQGGSPQQAMLAVFDHASEHEQEQEEGGEQSRLYSSREMGKGAAPLPPPLELLQQWCPLCCCIGRGQHAVSTQSAGVSTQSVRSQQGQHTVSAKSAGLRSQYAVSTQSAHGQHTVNRGQYAASRGQHAASRGQYAASRVSTHSVHGQQKKKHSMASSLICFLR
jgi:hypothetical protein